MQLSVGVDFDGVPITKFSSPSEKHVGLAFDAYINFTGSDVIQRIDDAIVRILSQSQSDVIK